MTTLRLVPPPHDAPARPAAVVVPRELAEVGGALMRTLVIGELDPAVCCDPLDARDAIGGALLALAASEGTASPLGVDAYVGIFDGELLLTPRAVGRLMALAYAAGKGAR